MTPAELLDSATHKLRLAAYHRRAVLEVLELHQLAHEAGLALGCPADSSR
jgi:hypothetical protein